MGKRKKYDPHTDSVAHTVKIYAAAGVEVKWPENMENIKGDLEFFAAIINEAPNIEWSPHKIHLAAILARTMNDVQYEQNLLRREGLIITNPENGNRYTNPRKQAVQGYQTSVVAMRRSLALHARGQTGDNREAARKRNIALEVQKRAKSNISDLIPRQA